MAACGRAPVAANTGYNHALRPLTVNFTVVNGERRPEVVTFGLRAMTVIGQGP